MLPLSVCQAAEIVYHCEASAHAGFTIYFPTVCLAFSRSIIYESYGFTHRFAP